MKKKYMARLNNSQCMFDCADDCETIEEMVNWSIGRGGRYVANFSSTTDPMGLSVTIVDDDVSVFIFDDFAVDINSGEKMRKRVNAQQMIAYLRKIL